ncbi:hypothetical protein [Gordonia oryzae]|uniref:hypothetical protein n=1 Tax=Gordonia oryzae TaxID=2487349 RepID=UPI00160F6C51|nr:hypothetical protein [Gordonia oryzae]
MCNRVNQVMGGAPLSPIDVRQPVARTLGFALRVIRQSAKRDPVTDPVADEPAVS